MTSSSAEILEDAAPDEPSDDELNHPDLERRRELRSRAASARHERLQKALDDVLPEVFAAAREVDASGSSGCATSTSSSMGAVVLHQGKIAEMKTGEGKTLVAPLAAALNAMSGRGVHVVTVNDYLAKRDPQWMGPIFHGLGLTRRASSSTTASFVFDPDYRDHRRAPAAPAAGRPAARPTPPTSPTARTTSSASTTCATTWSPSSTQRVQRERYFAIVDEVDNILIDEARTPLIISGQAEESARPVLHRSRGSCRASRNARRARRRAATTSSTSRSTPSRPTEEGIEKIERLLDVDEPVRRRPTAGPPLRAGAAGPRAVQARPRLHRQGRRDRHRRRVHRPPDARPALVGGPPPGDRGQGGPARPARVGDPGHDHLPELLPPVRQAGRHDRHGDDRGRGVLQDLQASRSWPSRPTGRWSATTTRTSCIRNENGQVQRPHRRDRRDDRGRPAGPGRHGERREERDAVRRCSSGAASSTRCSTPSSTRRKRRSSPRPVAPGAVTIATNMAGRGTDILLGGNPAGLASADAPPAGPQPGRGRPGGLRRGAGRGQGGSTDEDHDQVVAAGGLHIIGTERHDARRIDNQLRGRAGRQGDPGSSRFYLSLEDDLMKRFASRAGDRADGAAGPRRRRAPSSRGWCPRPSRTPRPASRATTSTSASASSSTTTSSTSSARRSTPSATRSSTTRT